MSRIDNVKEFTIRIYNEKDVNDYLIHDSIGRMIGDSYSEKQEMLTCDKWMINSPAKRLIFYDMYGDILRDNKSKLRNVADIGGGLSCLSKKLATNNNYTLVDPLVHDSKCDVVNMKNKMKDFIHLAGDWSTVNLSSYDIMISNDLFPNVDQRMKEFFIDASRRTSQLRILLTAYNNNRSYMVKRIDADEHLNYLAWDGAQILFTLNFLGFEISEQDSKIIEGSLPELYGNKRLVFLMVVNFDKGS